MEEEGVFFHDRVGGGDEFKGHYREFLARIYRTVGTFSAHLDSKKNFT